MNATDWKHVGLAFLALLGACVLSFILALVPSLGLTGYGAILVLALTPVLHAGLLWIKQNDTGNPAKDIIDSLPGRTR